MLVSRPSGLKHVQDEQQRAIPFWTVRQTRVLLVGVLLDVLDEVLADEVVSACGLTRGCRMPDAGVDQSDDGPAWVVSLSGLCRTVRLVVPCGT